MRYGIVADVHGNRLALQAAIEALRQAGVDEWLCAGDIIGYGPEPNECVQLVAELGAQAVVGNHELMFLGELSNEHAGGLCRETFPWTAAAIRDDSRAYLASLPRIITLPEIVMTHAALDSPDRYVRHEPQGLEQLSLLRADYPQARLLILGHTHDQWVLRDAHGTVAPSAEGIVRILRPDRFLLNAGSVGQSRQRESVPKARCMLLDTEQDEVRLLASSYDVAACRALLRQHKLPPECIHQRRALIPGARRRARRALRRLSSYSE